MKWSLRIAVAFAIAGCSGRVETDDRPTFTIDRTQPFQLEFGRGSGRAGLDTVKIDQTGRVLSAVKTGSAIDLPRVAGEGAKMSLLSLRERAGAERLLQEVRYVELSDRTDFNDLFVDELAFPG